MPTMMVAGGKKRDVVDHGEMSLKVAAKLSEYLDTPFNQDQEKLTSSFRDECASSGGIGEPGITY